LASLVDVPREHLEIVWPQVEHWIAEAASLSHHYTLQDVADALADGSAQLWLAWDDKPIACAVTQLCASAQGRYCSIWITAGDDLNKWIDLTDELEEWARQHGCKFMEAMPRPGFAKAMKSRGYRMPHVILEKEL
jgi:hypothetical protein